MNCKDYREAIGADPSQAFDGASHADVCDDCATYRDEMQALEKRIAAALEIEVPELQMPELPPIVDGEDGNNVVSLPVRGHRRGNAPMIVGLAASVAVAALLGVLFFGNDATYPSLEAEIIAHMDHERHALRVTDQAVSERRLAGVVRDDVSELDGNIGLISYARTCVINGKEIPHLVIQGEDGPVTVLLLPDEEIDDDAVPFEGEGIEGVILRVGSGSVAIIGERGQALNAIEQRVVDSVKWRT